MLASHVYKPFSHPLPELFLSGPKLVLIRADYSCCLLRFHSKPVRIGPTIQCGPWQFVLLSVKEPKNERKNNAQKYRRHQRKIEPPSVTFDIDVTGKPTNLESREAAYQHQKGPDR